MHFSVDAIGDASMVQRLDNGEVSVGQAYVFAYHRNINRAFNGIRRGKERFQRIKIDLGLLQAETLQHLGIKLLIEQRKRHFIDRRRINAGKHVFGGNVAEQGDLFSNLLGNFMVGAAHDEIRLNADGTQLLNAMLSWLGFHLMSCGDVRHQRYMHKQHVAVGALLLELARRLDKGLRFDVTDGTADLRDYDIGVRLLRDAVQALFNGIGNVRNNLYGTTQEVAAAFAGNEALVNGTLREVGFTREAFIDKTLVMTQVKVALVAVVGNEHLTMLERAHGARIHVQVGIHLLHGYFVSTGFEQMTQRCRRNPLAQGRNNAASHKDMLCHDSPS